ncbi:fasciclin domain-containing protein [uncultured Kordia sp.]|uniref:fasciclin domain-containing protein n=1 Tax=uncultured Kordia sp. TaxID=507699 RepID=UPI00260EE09B|nr:fasciclin domain-containing protein [uncultured Kordia sp.]
MKKLILTITTAALFLFTINSNAQSKDIVDIAASSKSFSTLVTAVKAAGLVEALKSDGPFTVFAPTNDAFAKIDANTLGALLKPENKGKLTSILTYHVIKGKLTAKDVVAALKKGKGKVTLTTLSGSKITVVQNDKGIWLKDANGNYSKISKTDVMGSNGVIHVIESVVMP